MAFVTNNSFVDEMTFDGMRQHLAQDFDAIYVLDLGGNVRKNPKILRHDAQRLWDSGGGEYQPFCQNKGCSTTGRARLYYCRVDEFWRKRAKVRFPGRKNTYLGIWNGPNWSLTRSTIG